MGKFSREFYGYNRSQVDNLLSEIIEHTEKILSKMQLQENEIKRLNEKIIYYQSIENNLCMAINHTEKVEADIKINAYTEAKQIISEARRNADVIINEALLRAESLELKNANMDKNLRVFKKKLRKVIEQQLDIVKEIELLEIDG